MRRIQKLEKRLDRVCAKLEDEKNKNLYMQAQLQTIQEARAEDEEMRLSSLHGRGPLHYVANRGYLCLRCCTQNALAVQVAAKFATDSATTTRVDNLQISRCPARQRTMRGVCGARAFTV